MSEWIRNVLALISATAVTISSAVAERKKQEGSLLLRRTQCRVNFVGAEVYCAGLYLPGIIVGESQTSRSCPVPEVAPPYRYLTIFTLPRAHEMCTSVILGTSKLGMRRCVLSMPVSISPTKRRTWQCPCWVKGKNYSQYRSSAVSLSVVGPPPSPPYTLALTLASSQFPGYTSWDRLHSVVLRKITCGFRYSFYSVTIKGIGSRYIIITNFRRECNYQHSVDWKESRCMGHRKGNSWRAQDPASCVQAYTR